MGSARQTEREEGGGIVSKAPHLHARSSVD